MSAMMELIEISSVLFMCIVAPLWLVLHYRHKRHQPADLDEQTVERLERLCDQAEQMGERIRVLEQLLDSDDPQWRR